MNARTSSAQIMLMEGQCMVLRVVVWWQVPFDVRAIRGPFQQVTFVMFL